MKTNEISSRSKKAKSARVPLFNSSDYGSETLIEQIRARSANLNEPWEYRESEGYLLFTLKGSHLQLRVRVGRKLRTGKLDRRPQIYIFDPTTKRKICPPKCQINGGAVTWRQNLANAIRLALPLVYSGSPTCRR